MNAATRSAPRNMAPSIFLCHAKEDAEKIEAIYYLLRGMGLDPWYDASELNVGDIWEEKILEAIENSDFFAILISRNSIDKSGFIQREIRAAVRQYQTKPYGAAYILPIKLDDCELPLVRLDDNTTLSELQWFELFTNDKKRVRILTDAIWKQWDKKN